MLKNLSILKKILLAFGLVILLLLIILAVSAITSMRRSNDLTRANLMSDMLDLANGTMDAVNEARVAAETTMTALDAEAAYNNFFSQMDTALANTESLDEYSAQMDGYAAEVTAVIRTHLQNIYNNMAAVHANDASMGAELGNLDVASADMGASIAAVYEAVSATTNEVDAGGMSAAEWMGQVINPVESLNKEVGDFRLVAANLTVGLDSSTMPDLESRLDSIEASAKAILASSHVGQAEQAALNGLVTNVQEFHDAMDRLADVMLESEAYIADMQGEISEVTALIREDVSGIRTDNDAILAATVSESNSTFILMLIVCVVAILSRCSLPLCWPGTSPARFA